MEICPKCSLPIQACVCEEISKREQKIRVEVSNRRYGKITTLVTGFRDMDIKNIARELKQTFACGGTVKNNIIELQGDHRGKVRPVLIKLGFPEEAVED